MTKVAFQSNGYMLSGNLFTPKDAVRYGGFLFIQGWTGHQNIDAAQAVAELGYVTMTYDMRGNGDSEGNLADFSRADFIKDAETAYDYIRQQIGASVPIGVVGSSFGSYTAVMLLRSREIRYLSLRVPANYPDEGYDMPHLTQISDSNKEWRKQKLDYTQSQSLAILRDYKGDVQIIEAEADEIVARQTPRNYADTVTNPSQLTYEIMSGAPHRLANDRLSADYTSRLVEWVNKLNVK